MSRPQPTNDGFSSSDDEMDSPGAVFSGDGFASAAPTTPPVNPFRLQQRLARGAPPVRPARAGARYATAAIAPPPLPAMPMPDFNPLPAHLLPQNLQVPAILQPPTPLPPQRSESPNSVADFPYK